VNQAACYDGLMQTLFITGTDTAVGKTHAACLIARQMAAQGLRVGVYKPVCSGAESTTDGRLIWDDLERLSAVINVPATLDDICPQRFLAPLAPPLAARLEGRQVDYEGLFQEVERWRGRVDYLIVEGAGGWLCPLTETQTIGDFAAALQAPVLIIARPGLGTINHTLLTVTVARQQGVRLEGVIFCQTRAEELDASVDTNGEEIARRGGIPVFGTIPFGNDMELLQDGKPIEMNWAERLRHRG